VTLLLALAFAGGVVAFLSLILIVLFLLAELEVWSWR